MVRPGDQNAVKKLAKRVSFFYTLGKAIHWLFDLQTKAKLNDEVLLKSITVL